MRVHPSERIILLQNSAFGRPEELPFDLKHKMVKSFFAPDSPWWKKVVGKKNDLAAARNELAEVMANEVTRAYAYIQRMRRGPQEQSLFSEIYANVRSFLDTASEYPQRSRKPWIDELRANWARQAQRLRNLATQDLATPDLADRLKGLASDVHTLATWESELGDGPRFSARLAEVVAGATPLLDTCTPYLIHESEADDFSAAKREVARQAIGEIERLKEGLDGRDSAMIRSARDAMAEIGSRMVTLSGTLELAGDPDAVVLRPVGHALHVAAIDQTKSLGFREETELLQRLVQWDEKLRGLVESA
jgi:hypothetical protein